MIPKLPPPFDTIDVWDEKYDYVMHDDHWLTSKWSADCEKCRATGKKPQLPLIGNNVTSNDIVKSETHFAANNVGATITKTQPSAASMIAPTVTTVNSSTTVDALSNAVNSINLTSSPVRNSHSMSITLKNETTRHTHNMDISPPPAVQPPPVTIAMTPIAHPSISTRAFMTPYTSSKFGGNETFNRTTRQSARKLLNQNTNQDLIDLNETFDLYRSCLAETPHLSQQSSPHEDEHTQQPQQQQTLHQQQGSSRIPKIPVRMPK